MRLTWRPILCGALVVAGGAPAGCASCRKTTLTVEPVPRDARTGPVTLEARLTAGGEPLPGAGIGFFVRGTGPNGWTGQSVGGARTNVDGRARLVLRGGLQAQVTPSNQVTGYAAEFRLTGSVEQEGDYCRSDGEAPISA